MIPGAFTQSLGKKYMISIVGWHWIGIDLCVRPKAKRVEHWNPDFRNTHEGC